ncbi:bifunctional protein-serine/threonine kinase/phosphatase [Enterovibrio calviensis]|uniref:bifunctional protein-serine/threonine kinase/phosphatase n=1 Tax=Enterovibrio calviensis TaxID=91359 RepID=UPI00048422A5|nr:bifunctional protein-serine/threonine kinase/phosphatase [Enterovibrio calviensis]
MESLGSSKESFLDVSFGACTNIGKKDSNDDAFGATQPEDITRQRFKGAAACIADGISNSKNSQLSSRVACDNFITDYYSTPDYWSVKQSASRVILAINAWLFYQDKDSQSNGGVSLKDAHITTFSSVIIKSNTAHIFHVGDSRVYRLRGDGLELLTNDHSYANGTAQTHLHRSLGLQNTLELDYYQLQVEVGDRFVLTTDGVHDALSHRALTELCMDRSDSADQELKRDNDEGSGTNENSDGNDNLDAIAQRIVEAAVEANTEDNASVLLLDVKKLPPPQIDEVRTWLSTLKIPPVLHEGELFEGFRVIRRLAKEARSHIYLVERLTEQKKYVLKMPAKRYKDNAQYMAEFVQEQWVGQQLNHPNIMKIHSQPSGSQFLYHVCEYVEGKTLRQWVKKQKTISLADARLLLKGMVKPVRYLHRNNIVHRDLKPENFVFDESGELKLIDLGSVQLGSQRDDVSVVSRDAPVGDIGYLAPEYLVIGQGSVRSDLYSLASIVYEFLTGELPYATLLSNQDQPRQYDLWRYRPISASKGFSDTIPIWVDSVLRKALAPDPKERYALMSELEADLRTPSKEILKSMSDIPLLKRDPLKLYKGLSLILLFIILVQFYFSFN